MSGSPDLIVNALALIGALMALLAAKRSGDQHAEELAVDQLKHELGERGCRHEARYGPMAALKSRSVYVSLGGCHHFFSSLSCRLYLYLVYKST